MRVIAGVAGRIRLEVPRGVTRPTTDRVREAVFSILGSRVEGARVLDLFAGSGALGIEALSRGACEAVFVDRSREACGVIERNLEETGMGVSAKVLGMTAEVFLKKAREAGGAEPYDLIFADPPYRKGGKGGGPAGAGRREETSEDMEKELMGNECLAALAAPDGLFVLERRAPGDELDAGAWWEVEDRRVYGGTEIVILARKSGSRA